VQYQDAEKWVDLDPLLPVAQPGATLTAVTQALAANDKTGEFALDASLQHKVVLRVVVEKWTGHHLEEANVLEHPLSPADFSGNRLALIHVPRNWPADADHAGRSIVKNLSDLLAADTEWLPILTMGAKEVFQRSFTDAGRINDPPMARWGIVARSRAKAWARSSAGTASARRLARRRQARAVG